MKLLDGINKYIGDAISWLVLLMVIFTFGNTISRHYFDNFSIGVSEAVMRMHAAVFMLGIAYVLQKNQHVRVDIFYAKMSQRKKAIVNLIGTFIFLLPFCVFIAVYSWQYVGNAWFIKEASSTSGGLPGLYLLKTLIPVTSLLLFIQAISETIKNVNMIRNRGH